MKLILALSALFTYSLCLSQEITYEDIKENEYVLQNEYTYRIAKNDSSLIKVQFTGEKFMKIIFPTNFPFLINITIRL